MMVNFRRIVVRMGGDGLMCIIPSGIMLMAREMHVQLESLHKEKGNGKEKYQSLPEVP